MDSPANTKLPSESFTEEVLRAVVASMEVENLRPTPEEIAAIRKKLDGTFSETE
jgi:hypothetical protein